MITRQNWRPAVAGAGAMFAVLAGLLAWSELDPPGRARGYLESRRLSPAERKQVRDAKAYEAAWFEKAQRDRRDDKAARLAKFEPRLVLTIRTVIRLDQFTVGQLLLEIRAVQAIIQNTWAMPSSEAFPARRIWTDQLESLRAECDRRRWSGDSTASVMDRARLTLAWDQIHGSHWVLPATDHVPADPVPPAGPLALPCATADSDISEAAEED
ncbi:hypothetical protein [Nocardia sp. NPDC050435]|uniref:hypothetical protein n=1 Tax=Nocardia sp. NPDC050435 TaxID=3155040 RepID=UPI0033E45AD9